MLALSHIRSFDSLRVCFGDHSLERADLFELALNMELVLTYAVRGVRLFRLQLISLLLLEVALKAPVRTPLKKLRLLERRELLFLLNYIDLGYVETVFSLLVSRVNHGDL